MQISRYRILLFLFLGTTYFSKAQNPGNISTDLRLWLKADAGTNTVIDGANVSSWTDQSPESNDAAQGTGGNQPTFKEVGINNNPSITFNGSTSYMTYGLTSFPIGATDRTIYVVLNYDDITATYQIPFSYGTTSGSRANGFAFSNTGNLHYFGWGNDIVQTSFVNPNEAHIYGATYDGATARLFSEGTELTSGAKTWNTANNTAYLGRQLNGGEYYNGNISEVIVFSQELSQSDREKVDTYLAIKYGITLGHDYFNTSYDGSNAGSTTIYDVSNGYANDIAGIGREDNEGLNQTKSKSENDDAVIAITSPTSLDDGDYLVWGNNDLSGTRSSDLPAGYDERLERIWFMDETGDVGTITVRFDLSKLGDRSADPNDYAVLISNSAVFSAASTITSGASISDNVLTFTNIPVADGDFLTLAVSAVRGPGAVSDGMNMWLKADQVTLDGTTLDLWPDQSGNSNHAEPVPFDRPLLETTLNVNNNPYINFTADNGGQVTLPSSSNQSSFIAVLKSSTDGSDVFEVDNNSSPSLEVTGGVFQGNGVGGFVSSTSTTNWNIAGLLNNSSTDHRIYMNGIQEDSDNSSVTIPASTTYNLLTDFTGEIAEIVYYEDMLTDTERRQVESYLAIKYGITLDISAQDYLNGSGSSILDRTAFTSYTFNIAGIGLANAASGNDAQGLNQTTSQSINATAIVEVSNASTIDDGEYLIWASDNETALGSLTEVTPAPAITGVEMILNRKWKIAETGDVGTVSITFDLSSVTAVAGRELAKYSLIVDNDENIGSPTNTIKPTSISSDMVTFNNVDFSNGDYFVLGTDVSASPGGISSNLALWFKAGAGITTSGSDVTSWVDQSSTGLDANTRNGTPTLNSGAINSNDAVAFDGSSNIYALNSYNTTNLLSGGTAEGMYTIYIVAAQSPGAAGYNRFFGNGRRLRFGVENTAPIKIRLAENNINGNQDIDVSASLTADQPNIYAFKRTDDDNASGGTIYLNGTNTATYQTENGVDNQDEIVLGSSVETTANNSWEGDIAEIIAFAVSEDDTDRQKIETYLAIKYGITLSNNYIGADIGNTLLYNVGNGYANDIAGIGRDDDELLAQIQSKSENSDAIITMGNAADMESGEYLIWGNDDGATTETATGLPSDINQMLTRIWSATETGDVQGVDIQFDLTGLTITGSTVEDFSLIVDGDATFNDGDEQLINANDFTANVVTFNNVDLTNGAIFTLATSVSANLTQIANAVGDFEVTASCPEINGNSYIDIRDGDNKLVFSINPNGNDLGATCWGVRIRTSGSETDDLVNDEDYFLDRNFYIDPTTQPATDVSLRFYTLNEEIDDIRAELQGDGKANGNDVDEYLQDFLRITRQDGSDLEPLGGTGTPTVYAPTISAYGSTGYTLELEVDALAEFLIGTDSDDPNQALPVELLHFTASATTESIELKWATASEFNNDYFTIERSNNGIDFYEIARMDGVGSSVDVNNYSIVDVQPIAGKSYYRLKQTDFDGTYTYSEIVTTTFTLSIQFRFYPNPVEDWAFLEGNSALFSDSHNIHVFDIHGNTIPISLSKENDRILKLDTSVLKSGVYFIKLSIAGTVAHFRFIK